MKKIVAGVIVIVIIALSAPFINGFLMKKTVNNAVKDINAMYADTGMGYSLEILSYKRGLLTSDIEWKVNLGAVNAINGIEEIFLTDHAKHGYTGVVSTTSFAKNQWFKTFIDENLQGKNPLTLTTAYALNGDIQSTFTVEAFDIDVEGATFAVKDGSFIVETDSNLQTFKSTGSWLGFRESNEMTMGKIEISSDLEILSTFLWDGNLAFSLEGIKVADEKVNFGCGKLDGNYQFNVDPAKGIISGEFDYAINKLSLPDKNIDSAKVKLAINNVDIEGHKAFMTAYTEAIAQITKTVGNHEGDPEKMAQSYQKEMAAVRLKMAAAFEKFMKQDLELKIEDLLVKLPEGDISANLTLRLLKDMTMMQIAPIVGQPSHLLDIIHLQSDISIPKVLVGENPKFLAPAFSGMQTGLFIQNGAYLTHKAETRDGKLFLNEKEVVLEQ